MGLPLFPFIQGSLSLLSLPLYEVTFLGRALQGHTGEHIVLPCPTGYVQACI